MSTTSDIDLATYCTDVAVRARRAGARLATTSGAVKVRWLRRSAELLRGEIERLQAANDRDLAAAPGYGLTDAQVDRLRLTPERIEGIAVGLEEVATLPEPIGALVHSTIRPNGLRIDKVRVPLGVVFFIYESRPNVTADAAAICVKAGNAVILRGGKEAMHSSRAIVELLAEAGYPDGFATDLWAMPVQRPYNPNARRIAELMQADLAKVGVKAEIKSFEWGEYRKRMQAGEHQMGMLGWTGDNGDPDNFLAVLLGCDGVGGANRAHPLSPREGTRRHDQSAKCFAPRAARGRFRRRVDERVRGFFFLRR